MSGRLVVVTGIDGSGKSSVLDRLAGLRPRWEIGSYQPRDWLTEGVAPHMEWMLERHPKTVVQELSPVARAAFLLEMFSMHSDRWIAPRLEQGEVVVMDSYWFRFAAKERVLQTVPEFFFDAVALLPGADAVFLLDLPIAAAAERKGAFDPHYEVLGEANVEGFIRFQRAVLEHLKAIEPSPLRVDAMAATDDIAAELVEEIDRIADGVVSS